ncbi:DNA alkylation repair enzyme [Bacteroides heparinolyticus]|uniref:DNA alkylation repair enzyme n=1 Tax=Prevotella heparinolytica TaxID=28113 RepID=A0A4R2LQJ0_9BACE|nr:DNA alkylation repair enzyme [Bacteroides heparinolyticus]
MLIDNYLNKFKTVSKGIINLMMRIDKILCDIVAKMLAKAFDEICKHRGYEASLPLVEEWINDDNPNVIRAVTEGLRIWTSCPFFKENPLVAIALIAKHKAHESEYLRKSVGNALRDISKKHAELIRQEVQQWDLSYPRVLFTYKLAAKLLK